MDDNIKVARSFQAPNLKATVWAGGHWSAGERFPKRPNFASIAAEEGFDAQAASGVWLRDEKQIGWFIFDGKPQRGVPLAWFAVQQMTQTQLPWRGMFRLDESWWWIVTCDEKGALHPAFDVVVHDEQRDGWESEHLSELASFRYDTYCGTPSETWAWIARGAGGATPPTLSPVLATVRARRLALSAASGVLLAGGIAHVGMKLWQRHEQKLQAVAVAAAHQRALASMRADLAAQAAREGTLRQRVARAWAQIPKPWETYPTWAAVLAVASDATVRTSIDGWRLSKVRCTVQAGRVQIERTWVRSPLATVASAPAGTLSGDGNSIVQSQSVAVAAPHHAAAALSSVEDARREVLAAQQRYARVFIVQSGSFTPYVAPVPDFVPKSAREQFHPPVLWSAATVTVDARMGVAPALDDRGLFGPLNVPQRVEIDLLPHSVNWKLEGTQYAQA